MNDVFARIGLALQHLLDQSTCHGPAREEVARLATELQAFKEGVGALIDDRVRAAVEEAEGRVNSTINGSFEALASALEAAEIPFTPPQAGTLPPPAPEPAPEPGPSTEPAPVGGENTDSGGIGTDTVVSVGGSDTIPAVAGADSLAGTSDQAFNGADPAAFDHDGDGSAGGDTPNPPTDDPDLMTVAQLKAALDAKGVSYPSGALKAELVELLKGA